ncbi:MAG: hypothetical protein V3U27_02145, partial [Candidatus Tectomicrobia bacterium]
WTDLRGSTLINRSWIITLLVPALGMKKLTLCLWRTLIWNPVILLRRPLIIPLLGLGICFWMLGFAAGTRQPV